MSLFWKVFTAVFISFVIVVSFITFVVMVKQISDAENHILAKNTTVGSFMSREIEHNYLESRWPLETLKKLSEDKGFLFWWVVRDDGVIHLADQASFMGIHAYDYFPKTIAIETKENIFLNRQENYGIFVSPLKLGRKKWSFWLGFSLREIWEIKKRIFSLGLLLSFTSLLLLGVLLYVTVKHFTAPIKDLSIGAAIIGGGDLTHRVRRRSEDELGQLADAFNKMAEDLQEVERFLALVFASIQDGISILDTELNILRVNPAMERWHAQAMPLVGKKCYEAYHRRSEPCGICPSRRTLETGQAARELIVARTPVGELVRYMDLSTFPLLDLSSGKMKGVVEYVRDVTEQKQAEEALRKSEEQLRQAQKMEAVGQLAGGVAHDFNNMLTAISGYCELLLLNLEDHDPAWFRQDVLEIQQATARATSLTQQLLAFSRRQISQPKVLDLNLVVNNLDKMLRRVIGEDIDLVTVPGSELGRVMVDPGQMDQVIINLAVNSRDAMPQGGKLTIETANVDLDENYARAHAEVHAGPYVLLAVSDTGVGLDAEAQSRIFEPFFTTKEPGKGTGLGLSTVYGIVKQSGGHIWVYSEPGRGTTFKIYLPRVDDSADAAELTEHLAAAGQGWETILLVEDEGMVRQVTCRILKRNGYTVLTAAGGDEALSVSAKHAGPLHLLLTDVVMPEMNGPELAARLTSQRPEMKVLYMSGHTENAIVHHGVLNPDLAFIQKPFRHDTLVRKVREVLDTPHRSKGDPAKTVDLCSLS